MKKFPSTSFNMILRPIRRLPLKRTTVFLTLAIVLQNANSKPQNTDIFENVASHSLAVADTMANGAMFSKNMDFELPFAKAKSETKAGTGGALRSDDDDSSEEDRRRKRSNDFQLKESTLIGEELLFPVALQPQPHLHRDKRSPCHTYGGGTTAGGVPAEGDEIDFERRLRAYARKRKAAAKKAKSKKASTNSRKKKLISDDSGDENNEIVTRRKRQSEVDDLNQTLQNDGYDFVEHVQQIAEKIRNTFQNFVTSMHNMAQQLKQQFAAKNDTNTMEVSEASSGMKSS